MTSCRKKTGYINACVLPITKCTNCYTMGRTLNLALMGSAIRCMYMPAMSNTRAGIHISCHAFGVPNMSPCIIFNTDTEAYMLHRHANEAHFAFNHQLVRWILRFTVHITLRYNLHRWSDWGIHRWKFSYVPSFDVIEYCRSIEAVAA